MFDGRPVWAMASTAVAHGLALPAFLAPGDIAILHTSGHEASLETAAIRLRSAGVRVEMVRRGSSPHTLEKKIAEASAHCTGKVWYLGTGVCGAYGGKLDVEALNDLMARYPNLMAYIDDSHGAGWCGFNGSGSTFDEAQFKDRLFLTFSLSKALGAGGAAIVVPDARYAKLLPRTEVPMAAAACEAARLMQTEEIEDRRLILMGKIQRFIEGCQELGIPLMDWSETPVFFLPTVEARLTLTYHTKDREIDELLLAWAAKFAEIDSEMLVSA